MKIVLYADGGCRGNGSKDAIGAWAYTLDFRDDNDLTVHYKEGYSGYPKGTFPSNNRMELLALIEGLEAVKSEEYEIEIRQDSKYVLQGAESWMPNWKKNNWRTSTKKPVKNVELWKRLDVQLERFKGKLIFTHVYGHNGENGNERVDELCNITMDKLS